MKFDFNTAATQKRLAYTGDKSAYSTVAGVTFYGHFEPVDSEYKANQLGMGTKGFLYFTDGPSDIAATDILTINSTDYRVRAVRRYTLKGQDYLEVGVEVDIKQ